ncbi:MAG: HAD family hydrolase, partial [Betaproteobacteria bacterium]
MVLERFDAIVFDWDGTLLDSTAAIAGAIRGAAADLGLPDPGPERAAQV